MIVGAVTVVAALFCAKVVFLPLALAILLAFLLSPLVLRMEKMRVPRVVAILVSILTVFALLLCIGWAVAVQLIEIANHLPDYRQNITTKIEEFHHTGKNSRFSRAEDEFMRLGAEVGLTSAGKAQHDVPLGSSPARPLQVREVSSTTGATLGTLHGVVAGLVETLLVVVFTFFILLQREDLRNRVIRLTGRGELKAKTQAMNEASQRVSRYFLLLLAVNCTYGGVIFVALHFLGLPHAGLFGALTALLRFVPYIGAPISGLLPITLALAVFRGWEQAGIIFGVFLCVEIVTANYIEPRLYGKHTGVTPLAILVSAVFWTLIWGPIGLLLSVPLTVCLAVLGSHVPSLKFLTVLLGDEPVLEPPAHYYQRLLAGDPAEARAVLETYLHEHPLDALYDSVLIPALQLSEADRHQGALDDSTAEFIDHTTRELVNEIPLRLPGSGAPDASAGEQPDAALPAPTPVADMHPRSILCVPVRDNADEIAALLLCQLLERAGDSARVLPVRKLNRIVMEVTRTSAEIVILSAMPPYAVSDARTVYRKLRAQQPQLEIVIGLWKYQEDPADAAREISRGEQDQICTTLAQALERARSAPSAAAVTVKPTPSVAAD